MVSADDLLDRADPDAIPDSVETGAKLVSGTTINTNTAWHAGNDGNNFHADALDGKQPGAIRRTSYPKILGLQLWWTFDENFSGYAADYSAHGRTGSYENGAGTTTGGYDGYGVSLDGTDDYCYISNWDGITGRKPRTWNFWFKSGVSKHHRFISYGKNNSGEKYDIRVDSNNGDVLRVENNGGQKYGSVTLTDGNWHMCTVVFPDGGTDVQDHRLYVDGTQDTNTGGGTQSLNTASRSDMWIGASVHHGDYVDGVMDDIRAFNRELSDSEITDLYNGNHKYV